MLLFISCQDAAITPPPSGGGDDPETELPPAPFLGIEGIVTTLTGTAGVSGSTNSPGFTARFNEPYHIAGDGTNLYVADLANNTIRKIVISTGAVTTLAGLAGSPGSTDDTGSAARFNGPSGVACDGTNVYVADLFNYTIRQIVISTGAVTTLAGTATVFGHDDGTGPAASFFAPRALACDGTNLYVADTQNHTIRQVVISTRVVTTLAGSPGSIGITDGAGSDARFNYPRGIVCEGANLYVADTLSHTIRKIVISTGVVTTLAGTGGAPGSTNETGTAARFYYPHGIASDGTNLYVADNSAPTIRKIVISTREVTTLAGTYGALGDKDATGSAARFQSPLGIARNGADLYVTDNVSYTIRKIVASTGVVTTFAGLAGVSGSTDCTTPARFFGSAGIASDGTNLYVADKPNHTIRKVEISSGLVTTLAGTAGISGTTDATGAAARFNNPEGITYDGTNLYVADTNNHRIRKIVPSTGQVTTLAGPSGTTLTSGTTDDTGNLALFNYPFGITNDGVNLYVADCENHRIRQIGISTAAVTTLAGPSGTTLTSGTTDGSGTFALFNYPRGIVKDGAYLYVADTNNHTIRRIAISSQEVTTLAGTAGVSGRADGTGVGAKFYSPYYLASDGTYLYVSDNEDYTIRKIAVSTGVVSTLAGTGGVNGATDGAGSAAQFYYPKGIVSQGDRLYVCDSGNNTIRSIR